MERRVGVAIGTLLLSIAASSLPIAFAADRYARRSTRLDHQQQRELAAADAREGRRRTSSRARAERSRSRTAYRNASRRAALRVERRYFRDSFLSWHFNGYEPARGFRVASRMGRRGAVVEDVESGERSLFASTLPLVTDGDKDGDRAPVSLSLVKQDDGDFETANALSQVEIDGQRPAAALSETGAGVALVGAQSDAMLTSDRAFYFESYEDTDALIDPQPAGLELSLALRSPQAPESFLLGTGRADTHFEEVTDGIPKGIPHSYAIRRDGETLGYVRPPVAYDSDGVGVDAELSQVSPTRLELAVKHRGRDLRYPVLADPELQSGFGDAGWPGWTWGEYLVNPANNPYHFICASSNTGGVCPRNYGIYTGFYQAMPAQSYFYNGAFALWSVQAPDQTGIYRFQLGNQTHRPATCNNGAMANCSVFYSGIVNPAGNGYEAGPLATRNPFSGQTTDFCTPSLYGQPCSQGGADQTGAVGVRNRAYLQLSASPPNGASSFYTDYAHYATLGYVNLWFKDFAPPTIAASSSSDMQSAVAQSSWSSQATRTIYARAHDSGGGLSKTDAVNLDGTTKATAGCNPAVQFQCDFDIPTNTSGPPLSISYTRPEGTSSHQLKATEQYGRSTQPITWTDKVDLTASNFTSSTTKNLGATDDVSAPKTYDVSVADARAGVNQLTARWSHVASGTSATPVNGATCATPGDGCGVPGAITVPPTASSPFGDYTVTISATDRAQPPNTLNKSLAVSYYAAPSAPGTPTATPGNGQATVSWTAPTSDGGSAITKSTAIAYDATTGQPSGQTADATGSSTTATVSGLSNGTSYYFKVKAYNAKRGYGPLSAQSGTVSPRRAPDAPTNVTAAPGDGSATVSWTPPAIDGGAAIDAYRVATYMADGTYVMETDVGPAVSSTSVSGLSNGQDYFFKVYARNPAGYSSAATSNTVRPLGYGFTKGSGSAADRTRLGLERYFGYEQWATGDDSILYANVDTGNVVWQHELFSNPGIGLDTSAALTYNSQDQPTAIASASSWLPNTPITGSSLDDLVGQPYRQLGVGFSLSLGTVTRLNEPLAGVANAVGPQDRPSTVVLTDADGTAHLFTRTSDAATEPPVYQSPAGLHLTLAHAATPTPSAKWILTRPNGIQYVLDERGYQTSVRDRNGNQLTFTYESYNPTSGQTSSGAPGCATAPTSVTCAQRVTEVTDQGGRRVRVFYYPGGSLSSPMPVFGGGDPSAAKVRFLVDHAGRRTTFRYDPTNGMLASVTEGDVLTGADGAANPDGDPVNGTASVADRREWRFRYSVKGGPCRIAAGQPTTDCTYLTTIQDPRESASDDVAKGTVIDYRDYSGDVLADPWRAKSIRSRRGNATTIEYDTAAYQMTATAPGGGLNTSLPVVTRYAVDPVGRPTSMTEGDSANGAAPYPAERSRSVVVWTTDNMPQSLTRAAGTSEASTTAWEYDRLGQPTKQVQDVKAGQARTVTWSYRYGTGDCPTSGTANSGDAATAVVSDLCLETRPLSDTRYGVDAAGNVTSESRSGGAKLVNTYADRNVLDDSSKPVARGVLVSSASETGKTTTYSTFDANGLPQTIVDPRGNDAGDAAATGKKRQYRYDAVGNVRFVADPRLTGTEPTAATNYTTATTYDAFDRPVTVSTPREADKGSVTQRRFFYDLNGNPTSVELVSPVKSGRTDVWTRAYDDDDNVSCVGSPPVVHARLDQPALDEAAASEVTKLTYDERGNVKTETTPEGMRGRPTDCSGPVPNHHTTTYRYDALNRPVAEVRTSDAVAGQAAGETLITAMGYDGRGNLTEQVDPRGSRAAGATGVANATAGLGSDAARRFSWTYDLADERTDQIEAPTRLDLHTRWNYDDNSRLETEISPRGFAGTSPDQAAFTTTYGYNGRDEVTTVTRSADPDAGHPDRQKRATTYTRDPDGRISAVTSPRGNATPADGDFTTAYTYYADGDLKSMTLPSRGLAQEAAIKPIRIRRNVVGDPVAIQDARGNPSDWATADQNTFYDSGELRSTTKPWMWKVALDAGGEQPELELRDPGDWGQDDDLEKPGSEGQGDFGAVGTAQPMSWLPRKGGAQFAYDGRMRLTSIAEDASSEKTLLDRDALGRLTKLTQPFKSKATENAPDFVARPTVQGYGYDFDGNRTADRAPGIFPGDTAETTSTVFDGFDRPVQVTSPGAGTNAPLTRTGALATPGARTVNTTYKPNGTIDTVTGPRTGLQTSYDYDTADRTMAVTRPQLSASSEPDQGERLIKTTFAYDAAGNRTCELRPRGGGGDCDAGGAFATRSSYTEHGQLAKQTRTRAYGTDAETTLTTSFSYDENGNRTLIDAPGAKRKTDTATDTDRRYRTAMTYDGRDYLYQRTQGDGSDVEQTTVFERDPDGNLRRTVNPVGTDAEGSPSASDDQSGVPSQDATTNATVQVYDADNLLTSRWLPCDPCQASTRRHQVFGRDGRGRVSFIDAPIKDDENGRTMRSTYTHFENGWIRTQTDLHSVNGNDIPSSPVGNRKSVYDYDDQGHQTSWKRGPGAGSGGSTTTREYWPNGLLARRAADGAAAGDNRSYGYGYNAADSMTEYADHQIRTGENAARQTAISYDEIERPYKIDETWGTGKDTDYSYDQDGDKTSIFTETDASSSTRKGKTETFKYDSLGRERSMSVTADGQTGAPRTITTDVYPSGQIAKRSKTIGANSLAAETFFYDPIGRLSRRTHSTSIRNPVVDYGYDRNGNRTDVTARLANGTDKAETFAYNARDQLIDWKRRPDAKNMNGETVKTTRIQYTYNAAGAMDKQIRSFQTGADAITTFDMGDDDQLDKTVTTQTGSTTTTKYYRFDSFGNQTCAGADVDADACTGGKQYTYDSFNRQTSARNAASPLRNGTIYDALDRRDIRCTGSTDPSDPTCPGTGATRRDLGYYGLSNKLSAEIANNGDLRTYDRDSSLAARGQDITANPATAPQTHTYRPYVTDDQGTVIELEQGNSGTSQGTVSSYYEYDPYGDTTFGDGPNEQGPNANQAAKDNPIRFQGFTWESDGEQYDMQARNYQPDIARFTSPDQYEAAASDRALQSDPLTQDRYAFLAGNPASRIENDGHTGCGNLDGACSGTSTAPSHHAAARKTNRAQTVSYSKAIEGLDPLDPYAGSPSAPAPVLRPSAPAPTNVGVSDAASGVGYQPSVGFDGDPLSPSRIADGPENPNGQAAVLFGFLKTAFIPDPTDPLDIASSLPVLKWLKAPALVGRSLRSADKTIAAERDVGRAAKGVSRGWSRGDDIYALTKAGNEPAWSTVRGRYWKNVAHDPAQAGQYGEANLARMRSGRAPQRYNADKGGMESMELSHEPIPFRDGGRDFVPRWPQDHAAVDPFRFPGY